MSSISPTTKSLHQTNTEAQSSTNLPGTSSPAAKKVGDIAYKIFQVIITAALIAGGIILMTNPIAKKKIVCIVIGVIVTAVGIHKIYVFCRQLTGKKMTTSDTPVNSIPHSVLGNNFEKRTKVAQSQSTAEEQKSEIVSQDNTPSSPTTVFSDSAPPAPSMDAPLAPPIDIPLAPSGAPSAPPMAPPGAPPMAPGMGIIASPPKKELAIEALTLAASIRQFRGEPTIFPKIVKLDEIDALTSKKREDEITSLRTFIEQLNTAIQPMIDSSIHIAGLETSLCARRIDLKGQNEKIGILKPMLQSLEDSKKTPTEEVQLKFKHGLDLETSVTYYSTVNFNKLTKEQRSPNKKLKKNGIEDCKKTIEGLEKEIKETEAEIHTLLIQIEKEISAIGDAIIRKDSKKVTGNELKKEIAYLLKTKTEILDELTRALNKRQKTIGGDKGAKKPTSAIERPSESKTTTTTTTTTLLPAVEMFLKQNVFLNMRTSDQTSQLK